MKPTILALAIILISPAANAQEEEQQPPHYQERVIPNEFALSQWCEQESKARYIAKNITPYQWSSRYYDRSNVLHVEGSIRANGKDIAVRCRCARGAREQYAVIEIDDPALR